MPIKFHCACGKPITAPTSMAGRKGKCPACGGPICVPVGPAQPSSAGHAVVPRSKPASGGPSGVGRAAARSASQVGPAAQGQTGKGRAPVVPKPPPAPSPPPPLAPTPAAKRPAPRPEPAAPPRASATPSAAGLSAGGRRIARPPTELSARPAADVPARISRAGRVGYWLSLPALGLQLLLGAVVGLHYFRVVRLPNLLPMSASLELATRPLWVAVYLGLLAFPAVSAVFLCMRGLFSALTSRGKVRAGAATWSGLGFGSLAIALAVGIQFLYHVCVERDELATASGEAGVVVQPSTGKDGPEGAGPGTEGAPVSTTPSDAAPAGGTVPTPAGEGGQGAGAGAGAETAASSGGEPQPAAATVGGAGSDAAATGSPSAVDPAAAPNSGSGSGSTSAGAGGKPDAFRAREIVGNGEAAAVAGLTALVEAERSWRDADADGNGARDYWTADVAGLGAPRREGPFVVPTLAAADGAVASAAPLGGYLFAGLETDAFGYPYRVDFDGDGQTTTNPLVFGFCAYPASGAGLTLVAGQDGAIWGKDVGGKAISRYPGEAPERDGWRRLK
ncbi:MAG: hypothetical protein HYZ53_14695 [Planctomycetes bacterium]|nr:hypothetical protein [Planctomycetota bacterium]